MRSEHPTTAAEWDMNWKGWNEARKRGEYYYCYIARTGVRKKIKQASHRTDRRRMRQKLTVMLAGGPDPT